MGADSADLENEKKLDINQEMTLEEAFSQLDELLVQLSDKEVSLDESFTAYARGMEILKFCNDHLDRVEKKMLMLNEEGGLDEF